MLRMDDENEKCVNDLRRKLSVVVADWLIDVKDPDAIAVALLHLAASIGSKSGHVQECFQDGARDAWVGMEFNAPGTPPETNPAEIN